MKFQKNMYIGPNKDFLILSIDYVENKKTFGTVVCPLCNNHFQWYLSDINTGKKKNCGCKKNYHYNDISNQTFNNLLVLERVQRDNVSNNHGQRALWLVQCQDCNQMLKMDLHSLKRGDHQPCPNLKGSFSKGETKIIQLLQELNIFYETQKTFNSCRFLDSNAMARFDFYLPQYNLLIEYNGEQHYYFTDSGWNTQEAYETTVRHDQYKKQWCEENNIRLITIPYTDLPVLNKEYLSALL
jgi:hypothetical protein